MSRSACFGMMQLRWKSKYALAEKVEQLLSDKQLGHRHHPGIVSPRAPSSPAWLYPIVKTCITASTASTKEIRESAKKLVAHLHGRHAQLQEAEIREKLQQAKSRLKDIDQSVDDIDVLKSSKGRKLVKQLVYNWRPIDYNESTSLAYLVGRSLPDYVVLYKIFNELKAREPDFKPYSLLDFGSGVGTVLWAVSHFWSDSLQEHVCIDVSSEMQNLSEKLIHDAKLNIKQVYYRQHLPAASNPTYNIVVSAYSLLELPDAKSRLSVLANLWNKTEDYFILVENGTRAGFKVINEARDFILNHLGKEGEGKAPAHLHSPCPHDFHCPRYSEDATPCNFSVSYLPFPIFKPSRTQEELYSYAVFRKGRRAETDEQWPRIVRPVLKRSRQVICRMCTNSGELREEIFTKWKSGKNAYRCARTSVWGDRLPVRLIDAQGSEEGAKQDDANAANLSLPTNGTESL